MPKHKQRILLPASPFFKMITGGRSTSVHQRGSDDGERAALFSRALTAAAFCLPDTTG
jgi:hypothetical protein